MSEIDQPITFHQLVGQCPRVEIPLIQRDFAQGRESEKEVRDHFLKALHDALAKPTEDSSTPLNLDFIYGSMEGGQSPCFLPLDGQQRLTTLFLLHWYLAWQDNRLADFKAMIWDGKHSRFTYGVRPSSTEFFDELVNYVPSSSPDKVQQVKRLVENQPWFFLHWRLDPTIQSALVMLDAMHELFKETKGLYSRLIDNQHPAITFQLLPLQHFGLTDDLYIKMNARGKPLTPFETFKARFEELLKELFPTEKRKIGGSDLGIPQFFEVRIDTQWTDFFWNYKDRRSNTFDNAVMNLIWALARVSLDPAIASFADDTSLLRDRHFSGSYQAFHERGWLTRDFAANLICLLEVWSSGNGKLAPTLENDRYFDEASFFQEAISGPAGLEYTDLIRFAALVFYLRHHDGIADSASLKEWMRVVSNLAANSELERPEEYGRCLVGLRKLVVHSANILEHLSVAEIGQIGFSPQQVREEVLKAKLILSHSDWRSRIDGAEKHGYFAGQIEFLLAFSGVAAEAEKAPVKKWKPDTHVTLQNVFDAYLTKAELTFNRMGIAPTKASAGAHPWKRALLTIDDYLVSIGSNYSLLTDPPRNGDSWKRFLRGGGNTKRECLKALWDRIDPAKEIESQLTQIIASASGLEPWRAALVRFPQLIDYCGQQEIRWEDDSDEIYLLKKRQMNGAHAELFSYALNAELNSAGNHSKLAPLKLRDYQEVAGRESEPRVMLSFERFNRWIRFEIESRGGKFSIHTLRFALDKLPEVDRALRDKAGFLEKSEKLERIVTREEVLSVLQQLAKHLAALPSPSSS